MARKVTPVTFEIVSATRSSSCCCCGSYIRHSEKYAKVRGSGTAGYNRFCIHCEATGMITKNYPEIVDVDDDGERGLREREAYAAYQAEGNTAAYWTDKDAGYIR